MNARLQTLKELAIKSALWPGDPEAGELNVEKFAELVVAECFKAAMIESKGHMNPADLFDRMKQQVGLK